MKNIELYNKTVDILYQSYFNDTLRHQNCFACAVGNIIASNCKYEYRKDQENFGAYDLVWTHTSNVTNTATYWLDESRGTTSRLIKFQVDSTGYTFYELQQIESAFESAVKRHVAEHTDEEMFNGLVAVLEVLKQIHEVEDDTEVREKFQFHYETLTDNPENYSRAAKDEYAQGEHDDNPSLLNHWIKTHR